MEQDIQRESGEGSGFMVKPKKTAKKGFKKLNLTLYLMILPAVIYYLIFAYLPMGGTVLAFKQFNYADGILASPWSGFKNFEFLFSGGKIFKVAFNTIAYNAVFIVVNLILQVGVAILLTEIKSKFFKKASQSIIFLPYFISWVIVGGFLYNLFNYEYGSLNTMLKAVGATPVDMYNNVGVWKYVLVVANAWKWVGYGSVIYLAAITGLDSEMYEAAAIDGAGRVRKIFSITLPLITPQIIIMTLLNVGRIFRGDFDMFYQVTANNPLLYDSTDVIDTYVVRSLLQIQDVGMTSAAGLIQSLISLVILLGVNSLVKRFQKDYALF
jgi:hypothetical protein